MAGLKTLAPLFSLLFLASCATQKPASASLPAEVDINPDAGRSTPWIIASLRLEDGQELPLMVDTGASATMVDKSLAPKLGKRLGEIVSQSWGTKETHAVYEAPPLYLGTVRLAITGNGICTANLASLSRDAGRPVLGVLGMDVLENYCVQFDFRASKMRLLDAPTTDKRAWGKAYPIVPLNARDPRPALAQNLLGKQGPHSLIDSGYPSDGWLMPGDYQQWTNYSIAPHQDETRLPEASFDGQKYPFASLRLQDVESDGIGLRFLSRHLVTLDFPNHTLYLQRQSFGPLPDPRLKATPMPALDALIADVLLQNTNAALHDLAAIQQSSAANSEKAIARKLAETLNPTPKPTPSEVSPQLTELPLGDARPESAEVGWLRPTANRIPLNAEIQSPLLDSGRIYATGLYAHSPSRYIYNLAGKWKALRGEAGLHTAFQGHAYGVVFIIKTDGKEAFRSSSITGSERVHYDVNLAGVNTLELQVEKAQDQNGANWALWLAPTLFREPGRSSAEPAKPKSSGGG